VDNVTYQITKGAAEVIEQLLKELKLENLCAEPDNKGGVITLTPLSGKAPDVEKKLLAARRGNKLTISWNCALGETCAPSKTTQRPT